MTLKKEKSNITQKIANKKLEDLGVVEKEQASVLGGTNEKNISNPTPSLFQYTQSRKSNTVSYTHLRAHETRANRVRPLLLKKK